MRKILPCLYLVFLVICCNNVFAQSAEIYQKAADGYLNDRNYQAAFDSYTKAIKESKHDDITLQVLYEKLGESLNGLNKPDDAIKAYNKAISLNPDYSDAYWNRGVAYFTHGKYQQAMDDYNQAITLIKANKGVGQLAILYCNIALCQLSLKNYPESLAADSISISLSDRYVRAYKTRGLIHFTLKSYQSSIDDYTTALSNVSASDMEDAASILIFRADDKSLLKNYKDAINDYSLSIKVYNKNGFAYWNRAAAYTRNGDFKLAADDYTTAMPFFVNDLVQLSYLYKDRAVNELDLMLPALAIKDDSVALMLNPKFNTAYLIMGDAYTHNGDYQTSINYYNTGLSYYTDNKKIQAEIYSFMATDEYFLKEYDKAVLDCSIGIAHDSVNFQPYFYRAKVYLKKLNKKDLATADFNKVLQLDTSKKSVGYVFSLLYTGKADEAISILQSELLTAPNSASLTSDYYNLACMYSLINQADEANIYLKKAFDNGYSKKYAMADEDLDNIRNTDDYKSMILASN
jgi:tetratricopeptide (TPR) repeat protein